MKLEVLPEQRKLRARRAQLVETREGIILKRGRIEIKIGGERAAEVVQLVLMAAADGADLDDICAQFAAPDRPAIEGLVRELEARRILESFEAEPFEAEPSESSVDVFYWHFDQRADRVAEQMNGRNIAIVGVNAISRRLAASLAEAGVTEVDVVDFPLLCNLRLFDDEGELAVDQWPAPLKRPLDYREWVDRLEPETVGCLVATADFGGLGLMRRWNRFCVERRCHFLPVVLQDLIGYVGPLVVPGETACFECLRLRQNSHLDDPETQRAAEAVAFEGQAITGFHPSMASILGDIAALELTKFYAGWTTPGAVGTLIEVNLLAGEMTARKVLKLPRCAVCSPLNRRGAITVDSNVSMPGQQAG